LSAGCGVRAISSTSRRGIPHENPGRTLWAVGPWPGGQLTGLKLPDSAPQIEASGRIAGYPIDADRLLLVLSFADREAKDAMGKAGDGRYYDVGSFQTDGQVLGVRSRRGLLSRGRRCRGRRVAATTGERQRDGRSGGGEDNGGSTQRGLPGSSDSSSDALSNFPYGLLRSVDRTTPEPRDPWPTRRLARAGRGWPPAARC